MSSKLKCLYWPDYSKPMFQLIYIIIIVAWNELENQQSTTLHDLLVVSVCLRSQCYLQILLTFVTSHQVNFCAHSRKCIYCFVLKYFSAMPLSHIRHGKSQKILNISTSSIAIQQSLDISTLSKSWTSIRIVLSNRSLNTHVYGRQRYFTSH